MKKSALVLMAAMVLQSVTALAATIQSKRVLIAIEGGGAVEVSAQTGVVISRIATGPNAFGALYASETRAFVTDKTDGTLVEIVPSTGQVVSRVAVGNSPQQPALARDGRLFIPLSGDSAIAVVDTRSTPTVLRKVGTGEGTKPHIVSLSPDQNALYVTIQGKDPKVVAFAITPQGETLLREYRYDIVPRVVAAFSAGAFFTGHHSTGLHFADLTSGNASTPYMDVNGPASEAKKQIEGVAVSPDGGSLAITHEGRKALVSLRRRGPGLARACDVGPLADKPYWVSFDAGSAVAFVSIPGNGTVQAYDLLRCSRAPLWTAQVGGAPKRMAVVD